MAGTGVANDVAAFAVERRAGNGNEKVHVAMTGSDIAKDAGKQKASSLLRALLVVVFVAAVGAVFAFDLDDYLTFEMLKSHRQGILEWYADNRVLAVVAFIAGYALTVALSVPGAVWLTLAGGFVFGTVAGTVIIVVAATLGALGLFLIARYVLADFFHEKAGDAGRKMEEGFRKEALSYLLFLRLVPVFPFWLVNLVPALLGIPARTFVIGTFLGIIPGTAVFSSVGNGLGAVFDSGAKPDLGIIFEPEILLPLLGLAVLALVPVAYHKIKASKGGSG